MDNAKLARAVIINEKIMEMESHLEVLEKYIEKGCNSIRIRPSHMGSCDIPISTKYLKIAFILEKEDIEETLKLLQEQFATL